MLVYKIKKKKIWFWFWEFFVGLVQEGFVLVLIGKWHVHFFVNLLTMLNFD
jgi:hypothetical protein